MTTLYEGSCDYCPFCFNTEDLDQAQRLRNQHNNLNAAIGHTGKHRLRVKARCFTIQTPTLEVFA